MILILLATSKVSSSGATRTYALSPSGLTRVLTVATSVSQSCCSACWIWRLLALTSVCLLSSLFFLAASGSGGTGWRSGHACFSRGALPRMLGLPVEPVSLQGGRGVACPSVVWLRTDASQRCFLPFGFDFGRSRGLLLRFQCQLCKKLFLLCRQNPLHKKIGSLEKKI